MIDKQLLNKPVEDVLIVGGVHKTMLFFHQPEQWSSWRAVATAVSLSAILGIPWWLLTGSWQAGIWVALLQTVFVVVDAAVLITLPKKRISFGPWKAQLYALLLPRWLATAVLSLFSLWLAWHWLFIVAGVGQMAITAAYLWGYLIETHRLRLTQLTIETEQLTADVPPIRLLHLTDLHLERLTRREAELLRLAQACQPDSGIICSSPNVPKARALCTRMER